MNQPSGKSKFKVAGGKTKLVPDLDWRLLFLNLNLNHNLNPLRPGQKEIRIKIMIKIKNRTKPVRAL